MWAKSKCLPSYQLNISEMGLAPSKSLIQKLKIKNIINYFILSIVSPISFIYINIYQLFNLLETLTIRLKIRTWIIGNNKIYKLNQRIVYYILVFNWFKSIQ